MCNCKAKLFDEERFIYSYSFSRDEPRFYDGDVEIPSIPVYGTVDQVFPAPGYAVYDEAAKKVRFGTKPVNEITIK